MAISAVRPRAWALAWVCLGFAIPVHASAVEAGQAVGGIVRRVLDGDTLIVHTPTRVRLRCRLVGIDAPELSHRRREGGATPGQPYGPEAKRALEGLALRRAVTAEVHGHDRYRRPLCVLWAGGRNLNLEMVREGHAWAERGNPVEVPPDLRWDLTLAEDEARRAWRGLWRDPSPEPPWAFRRRMRLAGR